MSIGQMNIQIFQQKGAHDSFISYTALKNHEYFIFRYLLGLL